jgi:hypothetical protein
VWFDQHPATNADADAAGHRDAQAAALQARIKQINAAQDSKILELEQLPPTRPTPPQQRRTLASAPGSPSCTTNVNNPKSSSKRWTRRSGRRNTAPKLIRDVSGRR